jgi:uncharacterized protein YjbI with pentapeptide repeats
MNNFYSWPAKVGLTIRKYLLLFLGISIGIIIAFAFNFLEWQKKLDRERVHLAKVRLAQTAEMIAAEKNTALLKVMSDIVVQINSELSRNPQRTLSDETVTRIAALSYSFTPYIHVEGDSVWSKKLSPERGQMLLTISGMKIDTASLARIFRRSVFSSANLMKADLENAYLKGVNLQNADLSFTNLAGANLDEANLKSSNLWGASVKNATLVSANLQSADASWSNLNGANLTKAVLSKALIKSAQLRRTDLRDAVLQRVNLNGALLNEANLEGADMLSVMMNRTNLSSANLSRVNLTTSTMTEVILSDVIVSGDWFAKLKEWKVTGAQQIEEQYKLVADSMLAEPRYRLTDRN